ncbi:MAG TPA: HD domain-containing protein, partial [Candidatus Aenigmarchaeota archaeon]|nr:HD domain-containing protein [Candidatus Aenigmarchaeota archaeon]
RTAVIQTESQRLLNDLEKTTHFLYKTPFFIFSKLGDWIFGQPSKNLHDAVELVSVVIEKEKESRKCKEKVNALSYYLERLKQYRHKKVNSADFAEFVQNVINWIGDSLTFKAKRPNSLAEIFKLPYKDPLRQQVEKALKESLADARRKLAEIDRHKAKAVSGARAKIRYALLYSFSCCVGSVCSFLFIAVAVYLGIAYIVRDCEPMTAVNYNKEIERKQQAYVRLKKAPPDPALIEEAKKEGYYTRAFEEILSILSAYSEWPASVDGHGSERGGLLAHSLRVLNYMLENANGGFSPKELAVCALAHDLGKILSYYNDGTRWEKTGLYHDVISGSILKEVDLSEFDQQTRYRVVLCVSHHHSPAELPLNVPEGTNQLLQLLIKCDAMAAAEEKKLQEKASKVSSDTHMQTTIS